MQERSSARPRVAIVGGGPGGLFVAYILNARLPDAAVTIYEGSDRLGGKIDTADFSDGTRFEAGVAELYEYMGEDRDALRVLIEDDLGLETIDISGGGIILRGQVLHDLDDVEAVHGYDTRARIEAFHRTCARLMPQEKYTGRWQPDNDHPWASKSFKEFIEKELTGPDGVDEVAREYIETMVASDLATESHTCNGLNGIKNVLLDDDRYIRLYHVVGGMSQIVDRLVGKLRATVRTNSRVTAVGKSGRHTYHVDVLEAGALTLKESSKEFDAVIVAMPNHYLRTIRWEGGLRAAMHRVIAHYDLPAHYLRVSMLFDSKWWADLNLPGEFWMMDILNGCCCYDESTRWGNRTTSPEPSPQEKGGVGEEEGEDGEEVNGGHVLSFLLAGGDALLMCSANQSDEDIIERVLQALPSIMREAAEEHFVEGRVDRYVGSINAQPGGWPALELRSEHCPEPDDNPGLFLAGDYFFDSTLNGTLMSAHVAVERLLDHLGRESAEVTEAVELLEPDEEGGEL